MRARMVASIGLCAAMLLSCGDGSDGRPRAASDARTTAAADALDVVVEPVAVTADETPTGTVATEDEARTVERPWIVEGGHETPREAVETFMAWADETRRRGPLGPHEIEWVEPAPLETYPGAQRLALVRFTEWGHNVTDPSNTRFDHDFPVIWVYLERFPGSDGWIVRETDSSVLFPTVRRNAGVLEVDLFHAVFSNGLELQLFASSTSEPVVVAEYSGGGVFASGRFTAAVNPYDCESGGATWLDGFEVVECNNPTGNAEDFTLVLFSAWGIETLI